jgi:hypothetical protein
MPQFNNLTIPEKASLIQSYGTLLVSLITENNIISLFVVGSQYLELYYDVRTRTIKEIGIASYENLDKYVEHVTLDLNL